MKMIATEQSLAGNAVWMRRHHKARFALQESVFGGLPTRDGARALSMWGEH